MEDIKRKEEFLEIEDDFRKNAFKIINRMLVELNKSEHRVYVDEILHSIFFLGKIHKPPFTPESIVSDEEMLDKLKEVFPRPFQFYTSQLPKRSPFSCVLDLIVSLTGHENEGEIRECLCKLIQSLDLGRHDQLVSSTICISKNSKISKPMRYYGVSMSTSGRIPGQIMVAAACLKSWDSCVANAVMTYYHLKVKKKYFDATMQLPKYVLCQAFTLSDGSEMSPCRSCGNLFGLKTVETREWAYGNCAEPESLSKLFNGEKDVKKEIEKQVQGKYSEEGRKKAIEEVLKYLVYLLNQVNFGWDNSFYTPQSD